MRFKAGDTVRVREDLEVGKEYGDQTFTNDMARYKGKIVVIRAVNTYWYLIEGSAWFFTDKMLESVEFNCNNCGNKNDINGCSTCLTGLHYITPSHWKPEQVLKDKVQQIAEENKQESKDFIVDYRDGHKEYLTNKSKMKIILLSGKANHGKDSAAKMLSEKLTSQGKKVLIAHYGDLVKYTCKTFFNWNGEKDEKGRTLLQRIGTDDIRAKHPDFWVDYVKSILDVFNGEWDYVLIPDTRFPNEIDLMKNSFDDVTSICVVRTNFVSLLTEEQRNHRSEIALDEHIFDYYLIADDLEKLERKVDRFLGYL